MDLYSDSRIHALLVKAYSELLETTTLCRDLYAAPAFKRITGSTVEFRTKFEASMSRLRRASQAVFREVDYRHRVEMRETSSRVIDIQVEQRKMLSTLKDQRRILRSIPEEGKIMNVVQEQHKIFQVVQQIQLAMQKQPSMRDEEAISYH